MDEKEMEGVIGTLKKEIETQVETATKTAKVNILDEFKKLIPEKDEDQLKALIDEQEGTIKTMIDDVNKTINDRMDQIEVNFKKGQGGDEKNMTLDEFIEKELNENLENLKAMRNGGKSDSLAAGFGFETKQGTMLISTNISGGNVPVEDRIEGLNIIASRRVRFLDTMAQRSTDSNTVSWTYQANKAGSAGQTAEGATKNQIDFDVIVDNQTIKKTTAFIKISKEMLEDISWMRSAINDELMRELLKAVESEAYSGDDAGENLNGVRTTATAFAAGAFANAVDNANEADVLVAALDQIEIAEHEMSRPVIFMFPTDVRKLSVIKVSSSDRRYVERLVEVAGSMSLDGVPIIKTTLVTQGEYLVGDMNLAMLVQKQGVRIEVGLDGNDFTKNLMTVLAEWRGLVIVKQNDRTAFVKGVFATDKAALETT